VIKVILVTGRILDELRRVAGDFRFVDGVAAENGRVLYFADAGHTRRLRRLTRVDSSTRRGASDTAAYVAAAECAKRWFFRTG
jgi:hypothetical protein